MNVWNILVAITAVGGFFISLGLVATKVVKYFRTREGNLDIIFQRHRPAINFTQAGPTLNLFMTLKAEKKDVFVREMRVVLIRLKDKATHYLDWFLFGDPMRDTKSKNLPPLYVYAASSFLVMVEYPKPMEILFQEKDISDDFRLIQEDLFKELQKWGEAKQYDPKVYSSSPEEATKVIKEFNEQRNNKFFERVEKQFYLDPGDYQCILNVFTGNGKTIEKKFNFSIDKEESKILDLNCFTASQLQHTSDPVFTPSVYLKPDYLKTIPTSNTN